MPEFIRWLPMWLAQIAPNAGAQADPAAGQNGESPGFLNWGCFLPAVAGLVLMYLMMASKPRQADAQKSRQFLANLKKNDRVVTAGGIYGVVVQASADSEYVTVRIDESNNTRIKLLKSSIAKVVTDENSEKDKEA